MPKKARELTAKEVRDKGEGLHAVGGVAGLLLNVKPTGARSWILRVMVGDRRRDIGLGGFPDVPLTAARERAREARELIRQGIDPAKQRQAAKDALRAAAGKRKTFREVAIACHAMKAHEFRNERHKATWLSSLESYAFPEFGLLPVDAVEVSHIVNVLEPIWTTKTETATRLRQRIETVLDYAKVKKLRKGDNPALWKGNLSEVLPKPGKVAKVVHHRALPVDAMPEFMTRLRQVGGMGARALEFAILTAARSGEVRGATWAEIDLAAKVWTVPGERMKAGTQHHVPLSPAAVALLKALPRLDGSDYVFPSARGKELSDMSLSAVTRRMGVDAVPHGFRSTFRDWSAEHTNFPRVLAEKALAHQLKDKVEAAYARSNLLEKRRPLMQEWAKYCATPARKAASVTPIRSARGARQGTRQDSGGHENA
jgi:integrase